MGASVRGGADRRCSGDAAAGAYRAAGRGLQRSAVTPTRPSGEEAGARARCSLDLGAVAPGRCVRIGRRGLGRRAGFGGQTLRRASGGASGCPGRFYLSAAARLGQWTPPLGGPPSPLEGHKMAAPGGGATAKARGARGPRLEAEGVGLPVPGLWGSAGARAVHVVRRAGPGSRPSPPAPPCSAGELSAASAGSVAAGSCPVRDPGLRGSGVGRLRAESES